MDQPKQHAPLINEHSALASRRPADDEADLLSVISFFFDSWYRQHSLMFGNNISSAKKA